MWSKTKYFLYMLNVDRCTKYIDNIDFIIIVIKINIMASGPLGNITKCYVLRCRL